MPLSPTSWPGSGSSSSGIGAVLYDQTLTGTATSIDTGAGAIPSGYKMLVVVVTVRSDNAAGSEIATFRVNNDSGANYDRQTVQGANAVIAAGAGIAETGWPLNIHGAGGRAAAPGVVRATIPNYDATTFEKVAVLSGGSPDSTGANCKENTLAASWRNTAAITRVALHSSGSNFVAGTRLTVYGF